MAGREVVFVTERRLEDRLNTAIWKALDRPYNLPERIAARYCGKLQDKIEDWIVYRRIERKLIREDLQLAILSPRVWIRQIAEDILREQSGSKVKAILLRWMNG